MLGSDCTPSSREDWQEVRTRVVDAEGSRPSMALEVELTIVRVELLGLGSGDGCPCCRKKADGSGVDRRALSFSTCWQCAYMASCALVSRLDKLPGCLSMEATAENQCRYVPLHQTKLYLHPWRPFCDAGAIPECEGCVGLLLSLI